MKIHVLILLVFIASSIANNLIIKGGIWYDGDNSNPIANNDKILIIKNGLINSIQPLSLMQGVKKFYKNYRIIDITGKFLVPGYYDVHYHSTSSSFGEIFFPFWLNQEMVEKYPGKEAMEYAHKYRKLNREQALRSGITALTEIGGPLYSISYYRETIENHDSPIFYPSGNMLWVSSVPPLPDIPVINVELKNISHAIDVTRRQIMMGAKTIKFYYVIPQGRKPEEFLPICEAVVKICRQFKVPVVAHPASNTFEAAIQCGVDALVHGVFDRVIDQKFIDLMKKHGTYYTPTFQIHEGYYQLSHNVLFESTKRQLEKMIDTRTKERIMTIPKMPEALRKQPFINLSMAKQNLKILHDAGVPILTGTDCGLPVAIHGLMLHREFEYYQEAGIKPIDILKQTTSNPSKLWKRNHGIIKIGFNGDLNILEKDPSKDARNLNTIHSTIRLGKQHVW
eukprot:gene3406-5951_t